LLRRGHDINRRDGIGRTPLGCLLETCPGEPQSLPTLRAVGVFKVLMEHKVDLSINPFENTHFVPCEYNVDNWAVWMYCIVLMRFLSLILILIR
jgi:hypothetical protein